MVLEDLHDWSTVAAARATSRIGCVAVAVAVALALAVGSTHPPAAQQPWQQEPLAKAVAGAVAGIAGIGQPPRRGGVAQ